jgi:hypothetical protein
MTDTDLDKVGTHRLIEALKRRSNILLMAMELDADSGASPEAACRQVVHVKRGMRINAAALGMANLLHNEVLIGVREACFGRIEPNERLDEE